MKVTWTIKKKEKIRMSSSRNENFIVESFDSLAGCVCRATWKCIYIEREGIVETKIQARYRTLLRLASLWSLRSASTRAYTLYTKLLRRRQGRIYIEDTKASIICIGRTRRLEWSNFQKYHIVRIIIIIIIITKEDVCPWYK